MLAFLTLSTPKRGRKIPKGSGLGLMAGIGYDMRATKTVSLTPTVTVTYGNIGQVGSQQFGLSDVKVVVAAVSIGVTFH